MRLTPQKHISNYDVKLIGEITQRQSNLVARVTEHKLQTPRPGGAIGLLVGTTSTNVEPPLPNNLESSRETSEEPKIYLVLVRMNKHNQLSLKPLQK